MAPILTRPIIDIILLGALAGIVGVLAVTHERVFYAESITHGTFPGAVLGVVIGSHLGLNHDGLAISLMIGAAAMCIPLAWLMHRLASNNHLSNQAAAGIVLTLGFALGYFLNTWYAPLPLKIESFLTGSVLTVTNTDVTAAAITLALVTIGVWIQRHKIIYLAFDPQGFAATGINTTPIHALVLTAITLTLVVVIPAVGTILAIALVAAPAAAIIPLVNTPRALFIAAPITGITIGLAGLAIAIAADISAGGSIALTAGGFYILTRILRSTTKAQN
ncbi:metal ABC transporter permease [Corynebacterium aquilae]|uniref:Zinc ABC transporter permease n=1 Tax=Corynebacterium aquilae DSM 44791 TaxID=1431546 RepID=A0A1L7CE50_9CORY|nr:metal ABC transporter permease [Corynebacterium aquilae]APT84116.1 hypothetical protein CAQU_02435 [Corynebacterium aquilae DSM 44791]